MVNSSLDDDIRRWACVCGIVSVVFYLLHDCIGAMYYPGYRWMAQAVSDLTAADAPSFVIAKGFTTVHGIFCCLCCAFLFLRAKHGSCGRVLRLGIYLFVLMHAVSAIGYSLFPLSSSGYDGSVQSFIHVYVITVLVVLLSIVSLVLIAAGSFLEKRRLLGILALCAFFLMFAGAVGSTKVPREYFGLVERFSTYSAVVFTGVLGVASLRRPSHERREELAE